MLAALLLKLGSFIAAVALLPDNTSTIKLALLWTAAAGACLITILVASLLGFHCFLIRRGITTYQFITADNTKSQSKPSPRVQTIAAL